MKNLISLFRCVWLELELNSAGKWISKHLGTQAITGIVIILLGHVFVVIVKVPIIHNDWKVLIAP